MNTNGGFTLSLTLHGLVAGLVLLFNLWSARVTEPPARVMEIVAGEGDNYMATEAPALGSSEGVKIPTPKAELRPQPPAPTPTPTPPAPTPPADQAAPNFKKQIQRAVVVADSKAKREIAKERAAEEKRAKEEAKRISKEEFDKKNKAKAPTQVAKNTPTKAPKVDAEGIAKGVAGGSAANKLGGAGGKALTANPDDVLEAYYAMFKTRLRAAFEPPPGLSDKLKVTIDFRSNADGSITAVRVDKSSGSAEFDRAVLEAFSRVKMPPRPDKKGEGTSIVFSMRDASEG